MQNTSALYKRLLSEEHYVETRLVIGESGLLVEESGLAITFGTGGDLTRILVAQGGADDGFEEAVLMSLKTYRRLFSGDVPSVGNCVSGEIEVEMIKPIGAIPRMAQIVPYIRLISLDGAESSEWIKKGVFFIGTLDATKNEYGLDILTIHGFDALAKAQADYPNSDISYPALDTEIVNEIANEIGVNVDSRTWEVMTDGYCYGLPAGYSMQEVLSYIGASYLGNWIITDGGDLRLVTLTELPRETNLLTDELGYTLVFGGDRILV